MADEPYLGWYQDARQPPAPVRRSGWRGTRRERAIDALACLAVAGLCFSQASRETLLRGDRDFYNQFPLGAPTLVALVLNIVGVAAAGFLGAQLLRRIRRPVSRWLIGVVTAMRALALIVSPLAVVTLAYAVLMLFEVAAAPAWRRVEPAPLGVTPPSLRRVVWLVLEELDQGIAFEARPPGLELPELDRLRRESIYADAAHPPAGATVVSMPALITGRPVVAAVPVSRDDLELTFADGKKARWSTQPNVFSRARALGYDTALIGWHLPYPRILGASLGAGAFRPSIAYEQTRGDTVGQALRNQWGSLAPSLHARRLAAQRFAELGDLAMRAAADARFGLVLLHLPLPRPEYRDSLALADRVVGELGHRLERARLRDRTWIVVSSDRWQRHDDHRVPFLVRPPDGGRAAHVDGAFNTLGTQNLVLAVLRGSVSDAAGAATWLRKYPSVPPRDYTRLGRPIY